MTTKTQNERIYDGDTDRMMTAESVQDRLVIVPEGKASSVPDPSAKLRIMWGQHMLDDLLAGRYNTLVCAVNPVDNSHGIISQLATLLPTSQWTAKTITDQAQRFATNEQVSVLKYDMDAIEVLALLRPAGQDSLTLKDLSTGFTIVSEMVRRKTQRMPIASVSFLGARANALVDAQGEEPSFETVLRTMHDAGFSGDIYPAPWMWESAPTAVFARYPFPTSIERMRQGGS